MNEGAELQEGALLRDYFAAAALIGITACPQDNGRPLTPKARAELAYTFADAMLKARRTENQG